MVGKINPNKVRYGARLGARLRHYFDNPPTPNTPRWTPERVAPKLGATPDAVRRWLRGDSLPGNHMEGIIKLLFGDAPDSFEREIAELWDLLRYCEHLRKAKHPLPDSRAERMPIRTVSEAMDPTSPLNYAHIDALAVEERWTFDSIRYGEGAQVIEVPGSLLYWLDPHEKLTDNHGERRALTGYFPTEATELAALAARYEIFFPRRVTVLGPKRDGALVRIFACTDIPYEQGLDEREGLYFQAEAILGVGGIAAFVDREGALRQRSAVEMGDGLGCVTALVAIAYDRGRPIYRSPYCLAVRKGIRYPDDVWISPATGRPIFSSAEPSLGRFLFQSRERMGGSTDMFAANFNGSIMVNLNESDETAWDGFTDDRGNDFVSWSGNRITFASFVTGKGFAEKITREDLP